MKIAALQSCYLPWTGAFELINSVDKFVFFDDLQFTKRDWRTRNYLNANGSKLLINVPVQKHKLDTKIIDIKIDSRQKWFEKHYKSFYNFYSRSKYFDEYKYLLDYLKMDWEYLYDLNRYTMETICDTLGMKTEIYYSERIDLKSDDKNGRILEVVKELGGNHYITGPKAKNYIDESLFTDIKLEYMEYKTKNHFTVLDNIFNNGVDIL